MSNSHIMMFNLIFVGLSIYRFMTHVLKHGKKMMPCWNASGGLPDRKARLWAIWWLAHGSWWWTNISWMVRGPSAGARMGTGWGPRRPGENCWVATAIHGRNGRNPGFCLQICFFLFCSVSSTVSETGPMNSWKCGYGIVFQGFTTLNCWIWSTPMGFAFGNLAPWENELVQIKYDGAQESNGISSLHSWFLSGIFWE